MNSIIQNTKECYLCRQMFGEGSMNVPTERLHYHHLIPGTSNRKKSDQYGLAVWLCVNHHKFIHSSKGSELMKIMKNLAKEVFIEKYSEEEFMREFKGVV